MNDPESKNLDPEFPVDDYVPEPANEGERLRLYIFLALTMVTLAVLGVIIWMNYQNNMPRTEGDLPLIQAQTSPYKQVPEDPGGRVLADTDRRIYDQIDGSDRPLPEQLEADTVNDIDAEMAGSAEPALEGATGPAPNLSQDNSDQADVSEAVSTETLSAPSPERAPVEPDSVPPSDVSLSDTASQDYYLVQLASFRSSADADALWTRLNAAQPSFFSGAKKIIQEADLGDRGLYYRLQVGLFESREDANGYCVQLKQSGQDCLVVKQ